VIEGRATARYVRGSVQKAGLVLDLIRGKDVNAALATLQFCRKSAAHHVLKVLRSAVANVQQHKGASSDIDRLYVEGCYANQGPSLKRVRPAPMGRAFRIAKRTSHLTVTVRERPEVAVGAVTVDGSTPGEAVASSSLPKRKTATKKTTAKAKAADAATTGKVAKKAKSVDSADA
jgi:large subunit ribosomal protein L22